MSGSVRGLDLQRLGQHRVARIQRPLVHRHPRMASATQTGGRGGPDARHAAHRRGAFIRLCARTGRRPAVLNGLNRKTPAFDDSKAGVFLDAYL